MRKVNRRADGKRRWGILQKYEIPDLLNPDDIYLTRWRIIQTPWFGMYLHLIWRADNDRHLHNHPWNFMSIILRGGYLELTEIGNRRWRPGSMHRMGANHFHAIKSLDREPTVTLVFVGKKKQDWGYKTDRGFTPQAQYHAVRRAGGDYGLEA